MSALARLADSRRTSTSVRETCHKRPLAIRSSEPAAIEEGAFGDMGPIYDQREGLLIARVDFLGKVVAGTGFGDHVLADAIEFLQHRVVELQDLTRAFVAQLAQPQCIVEVELREGARVFGRSCVFD